MQSTSVEYVRKHTEYMLGMICYESASNESRADENNTMRAHE